MKWLAGVCLALWGGLKPAPVFGKVFEIKRVEFEGLKSSDASLPMFLRNEYVGQEYTPNLGQQLISQLYLTGEVEQVHLLEKEGTLVVRFQPRPRIAAIDISAHGLNGRLHSEAENLVKRGLEQQGIVLGSRLNPPSLDRLGIELKEYYEAQGVHSLSYRAQLIPISEEGALRIRIHVVVGDPACLSRASILGANPEMEKKAYEALTYMPDWYTKNRLLGQLFDIPFNASQAIQENSALERTYHNEGYLSVVLGEPEVTLSPTKSEKFVSYIVEDEGPKYFWGDVELRGSPEALEILKGEKVEDRSGKPYNREDLEKVKLNLRKKLQDHGYLAATVQHIEVEQPDNPTFENVKFYCSTGPRSYHRRVRLESESNLRAGVYFKYIRKHGGSPADSWGLTADQIALNRLNCFEEVDVSTQPVPNRKDLFDVVVKAKPSSQNEFMNLSYATGREAGKGSGLSLDLGTANFLYTGRTVRTIFTLDFPKMVKVGKKNIFSHLADLFQKRSGSVEVTYSDPVIFGANHLISASGKWKLGDGAPVSPEQEIDHPFSFQGGWRWYFPYTLGFGSNLQFDWSKVRAKGKENTGKLPVQLDDAINRSPEIATLIRKEKLDDHDKNELVRLLRAAISENRPARTWEDHKVLAQLTYGRLSEFFPKSGASFDFGIAHLGSAPLRGIFQGEGDKVLEELKSGSRYFFDGKGKIYFPKGRWGFLPTVFRADFATFFPIKKVKEFFFETKTGEANPIWYRVSDLMTHEAYFATSGFSALHGLGFPGILSLKGPNGVGAGFASDFLINLNQSDLSNLKNPGLGYFGLGLGGKLPLEKLVNPSLRSQFRAWGYLNSLVRVPDDSARLIKKLVDDHFITCTPEFAKRLEKLLGKYGLGINLGCSIEVRVPKFLGIFGRSTIRVAGNYNLMATLLWLFKQAPQEDYIVGPFRLCSAKDEGGSHDFSWSLSFGSEAYGM